MHISADLSIKYLIIYKFDKMIAYVCRWVMMNFNNLYFPFLYRSQRSMWVSVSSSKWGELQQTWPACCWSFSLLLLSSPGAGFLPVTFQTHFRSRPTTHPGSVTSGRTGHVTQSTTYVTTWWRSTTQKVIVHEFGGSVLWHSTRSYCSNDKTIWWTATMFVFDSFSGVAQ